LSRPPTPALSDVALAPGLYVSATPIGNLRDVTLRVLDVLAGCDLVLAEDTRVTGKLPDWLLRIALAIILCFAAYQLAKKI